MATKINWYEGMKPTTISMSNDEMANYAIDMRSYYDVSPSGLWGEYDQWHTTSMTIYNDEGEIFAKGRRTSKDRWSVRTIINQ